MSNFITKHAPHHLHRNKNLIEDKNGSGPGTGETIIKILHSLNVQLTRKHKATDHTKYSICKFYTDLYTQI